MKNFATSNSKIFYSCLLSPLAVIPATILYAVFIKLVFWETEITNFSVLPFVIVATLMFAAPLVVILGIPVCLLLQNRDRFKLSNILGLVILGTIFYGFFSGMTFTKTLEALYFSLCVASAFFYVHRVA